MKNNQLKIHSQEYMETMARLMSEALESPEGMQALAAAIAAPAATAEAPQKKWWKRWL